MIILCLVVSLLALVIIIAPFFMSPGEPLQASASVNSVEKLEAMRQALLRRYLDDEQAFANKAISRAVWERRKTFLANRFVDVTRRQDFLRNTAQDAASSVETVASEGVRSVSSTTESVGGN